MFALVDCNNFYVSCEMVFDPSLENKAVVVLSNNDGCIISRSNEAKKLGFAMGEPIFKKTEWIKKYNVKVFSSNYTLYGDMSQRVMDTLCNFSPETEIYSIDECFLNIDHIPFNDLYDFGLSIKKTILKNTGIGVGVGIGSTKTLAKIANHIAKKRSAHNGVFVFDSERSIKTALRNTPVQEIWGIGRQYANLLHKNKIDSAHEFTLVNDHWIKSNMSVMGLRIKNELKGTSCLPLESLTKQKKAIATTRAFGNKTNSIDIIKEAVAAYASRCGEKLRKQKCVANLLTVFIHTDPFNPNEKYINYSKTISLPVPSNSQTILVKYAILVLKNIFKEGLKYKKAGVIVDGLEPDSDIQTSCFDQVDNKMEKSISSTINSLNARFGRDTVKTSIQGNGKQWQLRQEKLSRKYTTNMKDIIEIIAKNKD